jgi:hypothetical protein
MFKKQQLGEVKARREDYPDSQQRPIAESLFYFIANS